VVDLSIVIVSWNTRELLKECLESVYQYTKSVTFEVFVVDNASSDGSADMVRELFPQVNVIANNCNAGFSKANNQAIRISKGRYVALLNPDTLLIEALFSPLVKYADQHQMIGVIGPKILNKDKKTIQYSCARRLPSLYFSFCHQSGLMNKFPKSRIFSGTSMTYWDYESSRFVECLSGACMIVRKSAIDDVGLMDENQFMYGDDTDWCKRFLDAGWKIYYYSAAKIIHYSGKSSAQMKVFSSNEDNKATWYYYRKHKGKVYAFAYSVLVCFLSSIMYIRSILLRRAGFSNLSKVYKANLDWSVRKILGRE
jgi:GT2 family glycosyltransferase